VSAIDTILTALDRAKQVRPNQWMTACPCCKSRKGRPLAVTDASDGRVLMHAFCGCSTESVLAALGMTVNDLFDRPLEHRHEPMRVSVSAREILSALSMEVTFVSLLAADIREGRAVSEEDWQRLAVANDRIGAARAYVG
jgi:hypothetical protein